MSCQIGTSYPNHRPYTKYNILIYISIRSMIPTLFCDNVDMIYLNDNVCHFFWPDLANITVSIFILCAFSSYYYYYLLLSFFGHHG